MAKIKLTTKILDYENNEILVAPDSDRKLDIRALIVTSLNNTLPDENLLAEDKAQIFQISMKLYKGKEVDLSVNELAFIKLRAEKILLPLTLGRLLEVIDPKPNEDVEPARKPSDV